LKLIILLCPCLALFSHPGYFEPWGNDFNLKHQVESEEAPPKPSIAAHIADAIIRFHQEVISPVDGPRSHFRPTSSRYMQLAVQRYGFLKGFIMGCDRLLRENNEEWVYRTIEIDGQIYKYDPAKVNKYR
jgi:putative component of membrane protein insertase Oxa1/YidC/SpoIIIJ protein YidD